MIKNILNIIFIFLFLVQIQNSFSQSKTLRFEHLTTESGLPRNQVYSLLQDNKGYIWAGTGDGLSRYDGYKFKIYNNETSNLVGKHVVSIYEDNEYDLWVATNKGISKFNRANGEFKNFGIDSTLTSNGKDYYANMIFEDNKKQLWVGTEKGLFLFNRELKTFIKDWSNNALKNKLDDSWVSSVIQDSKQRLWIGTKNNGVFSISYNLNNEIENIKNYLNIPDDSSTISHNQINDIKEDKNGVIWFATKGGLCKLDASEKLNSEEYRFQKIKSPFKKDIAYFDMTSSITVDKENNLFVGHLNGLYFLPNKASTLENIDIITNNALLKHNYSMDTQFIDKSGVLWLTSSNGIYKHDLFLLKFNVHRANQDNSESSRQNLTWSILKDQDNQVWLGTSFGLNKLEWSEKTKKYEYVHIPNNAEEISVQNKYSITGIIELDKNNLIISNKNGLYKLNKQNLLFTKLPLPSNKTPRAMCLSYNKTLWIATNNGILKYNINTEEYKEYLLPMGVGFERNNRAFSIHMDINKQVWVGTLSGINVFLPKEEKAHFIKTKSISEYKSVWSIYSDTDGSIWYGKWGDGLAHIVLKGDKLNFDNDFSIEEFHVKDGLPNEYIYSVVPDQEGNLWMSTNMGLSKFNPKTKQFENYTADEGLQSNEFNSGAYFKADDGELFFGGPSGINSFYPSTTSKNPTIPNVVITNVIVNGKEIKGLSDDKNLAQSKIVLKHDQNPLKFEFSALDYSNSSKNKYKIQLENYDETWVMMDHNTSITYSKLPSGKYSFKVKGANHDGYWNENTTSLNIEITPPYWRTWWFYTLCALLLICVMFLILNFKLKQVKLKEKNEYYEKQNEEKKAAIKEIHHRIKNNLQVVISLLRMQSSQVKEEKVVGMFKEAQKRILSMALLHEKMQQGHGLKGIDVQEHLKTLIQGLIKSYAVGKDIDLNIKVSKIKLGMETLTPLGLVVNELITNSLKYGFAEKSKGLITVQMKQLDNGSFEIFIGDDGVGFNPKEKPSSLGTKLIGIFVKQLNGTITLLNQPGTKYKIIFQKNNSNC
jgi:two-component sensor histidine kinase/ligand-binding sensor domain-containing protein